MGQLSVRRLVQHIEKTAFQSRQDRFGFRVAEPDIEFQHFRTGFRYHDPRVNDAAVFEFFRPDPGQETIQHLFLDCGHEFIGHHRRGRIRPHASGIGAAVMIQQTFVILRRDQRHDAFAVGQGQDRGFFAFQQFFQHHQTARRAERSGKTRTHRVLGFPLTGGHDHAFSRRQTVRLHDHAASRGIFGSHVFQRGSAAGKTGITRSRDTVFDHKLFGEILAAFQSRTGFGRTENRNAPGPDRIGNTLTQRKFRSNHQQVDPVLLREIGHRFIVSGRQCDTFCDLRDARIAWGTIQLLHFGTQTQPAADRVFTSAAA